MVDHNRLLSQEGKERLVQRLSGMRHERHYPMARPFEGDNDPSFDNAKKIYEGGNGQWTTTKYAD